MAAQMRTQEIRCFAATYRGKVQVGARFHYKAPCHVEVLRASSGPRRGRAVGERQRSLSLRVLVMALGEAEGGVAAGTEAEDITEVLKSERAGRRLPLKEHEITASAELLAEYVTADEVWSNLGDEDYFGVYADTFAQAIGKELPPIQMALAKRWWMNGPAPREKEGI